MLLDGRSQYRRLLFSSWSHCSLCSSIKPIIGIPLLECLSLNWYTMLISQDCLVFCFTVSLSWGSVPFFPFHSAPFHTIIAMYVCVCVFVPLCTTPGHFQIAKRRNNCSKLFFFWHQVCIQFEFVSVENSFTASC